jgi:hypothetical protein
MIEVFKSAFRPVLVHIRTAAVLLRYDPDTVLAMADAGELRWVWDVSTRTNGDHARDLRFWLGEVMAPRVNDRRSLEEVVKAVVGTNEVMISGHRIRHTLDMDQATLRLLRMRGHVKAVQQGREWRYWRKSFDEFLTRRWLGNVSNQ